MLGCVNKAQLIIILFFIPIFIIAFFILGSSLNIEENMNFVGKGNL